MAVCILLAFFLSAAQPVRHGSVRHRIGGGGHAVHAGYHSRLPTLTALWLDNAGGIAEMAGLEPEVRTDALTPWAIPPRFTGKGLCHRSGCADGAAPMASHTEKVKEVGADVTFEDFR